MAKYVKKDKSLYPHNVKYAADIYNLYKEKPSILKLTYRQIAELLYSKKKYKLRAGSIGYHLKNLQKAGYVPLDKQYYEKDNKEYFLLKKQPRLNPAFDTVNRFVTNAQEMFATYPYSKATFKLYRQLTGLYWPAAYHSYFDRIGQLYFCCLNETLLEITKMLTYKKSQIALENKIFTLNDFLDFYDSDISKIQHVNLIYSFDDSLKDPVIIENYKSESIFLEKMIIKIFFGLDLVINNDSLFSSLSSKRRKLFEYLGIYHSSGKFRDMVTKLLRL